MFNKDDFINYFNQVSDIEKKMVKNVEELLELIKENTMVTLLEKIKKDEIRHVQILKKIGKIIYTINDEKSR